MTGPIRVFLADDNVYLVEGLSAVLSHHSDISVVGRATGPVSAIESIRQLKPDVAFIDILFDDFDLNGIDVIHAVREESPQTACLVLSALVDWHLIDAAIQSGAKGYLYKSAENQEVSRAIRSLAAGKLFLSDKVMRTFATERPVQHDLTPTEIEIVEVLSQTGGSDKEIARLINKSARTVSTHISNIIDKLRRFTLLFDGQRIEIDSRTKVILWWLNQNVSRSVASTRRE